MQKKFHISSFLPIGRLTVCINKLSDSFQPTTFCHILQHPTANSNLGIVALKNFSIFGTSPLSLSLIFFSNLYVSFCPPLSYLHFCRSLYFLLILALSLYIYLYHIFISSLLSLSFFSLSLSFIYLASLCLSFASHTPIAVHLMLALNLWQKRTESNQTIFWYAPPMYLLLNELYDIWPWKCIELRRFGFVIKHSQMLDIFCDETLNAF